MLPHWQTQHSNRSHQPLEWAAGDCECSLQSHDTTQEGCTSSHQGLLPSSMKAKRGMHIEGTDLHVGCHYGRHDKGALGGYKVICQPKGLLCHLQGIIGN